MTTEARKAAFDKLWEDANAEVAQIRARLNDHSERLAIQWFGMPEPEKLMGPPDEPVKVECWHCGQMYQSDQMVWEYRLPFQSLFTEMYFEGDADSIAPLWWCKNRECDGAGFGHDIHIADRRKKAARKSKARGA